MSKKFDELKVAAGLDFPATRAISRRNFLMWTGVATASGIMIASCKKDSTTSTTTSTTGTGTTVNLGSGDTGILNYAYALEQLEAAFYIQVLDTPYANISSTERDILTDIRAHEIAHREFFKKALGAGAIIGLTPDFSSINFNDRASVLNTAKAFEDLGVSAYNGAGALLKDKSYLLAAGKIVSVEARHAAAIRDLLMPNTSNFAGSDVIDGNGLDKANTPATVLATAGTYVKNKIDFSNLPK